MRQCRNLLKSLLPMRRGSALVKGGLRGQEYIHSFSFPSPTAAADHSKLCGLWVRQVPNP